MENDTIGLSTFSGLDTYQDAAKYYIHDVLMYNFNTSQHTRDGKRVPVYIIKILLILNTVTMCITYLCKNIDNQVDYENERHSNILVSPVLSATQPDAVTHGVRRRGL